MLFTIEELLTIAKERKASDVHVTVGLPPRIRINGELVDLDYPKMTPADCEELILSIMDERQKELFKDRGELDFSFSFPNVGRYRVNVFRQRGSVACAMRVVGTVIPILLGIALGMSTGGSPLGAIMYIIVWNLFAYFGMKFLYFKGYELGGKAVDFLVGPQGEAIRESVTMLAGIVIGAVSATWISVTTSFTMTAAGAKKPFIDLQKTLDGVYPGLLTAVFVVGCWYLLSKKKMSPIKVMLLLVVVAFIGVLVGFFNPGLSY